MPTGILGGFPPTNFSLQAGEVWFRRFNVQEKMNKDVGLLWEVRFRLVWQAYAGGWDLAKAGENVMFVGTWSRYARYWDTGM